MLPGSDKFLLYQYETDVGNVPMMLELESYYSGEDLSLAQNSSSSIVSMAFFAKSLILRSLLLESVNSKSCAVENAITSTSTVVDSLEQYFMTDSL